VVFFVTIKFLAGLVFLLFAQHLVSHSRGSVITKVGIVGHRAGKAIGLVVVNSWDTSVVDGGDWGSVVVAGHLGSVVVGRDWSWNSSIVGSDNWCSYGNGLLVIVGLRGNLDMNIWLAWDLDMNIGFAWDLDMHIFLSWDLLVDIWNRFDLLMNIWFAWDLDMHIGFGRRVEVGISYGGIVGGSMNSSEDSSGGKSSRHSVVASWEANMASRVTIASIASIASIANWESSLSMDSGQTRQNSDKGLHCDLVNCYY